MKNYYILAFAAFSFIFTTCSSLENNPRTDWKTYDLRGKVKELHIKNYDARMAFGELTKTEIRESCDIYFNEDGKISKKYTYLGDTEKPKEEIFTYSDNRCVHTTYMNGTIKDKCIVTYTDWGATESVIWYTAEGKDSSRVELTYNDKKQIVEVSWYQKNVFEAKNKFYEYNDQGLITKYISYDEDGELDDTYVQTWDRDKRITSYAVFDKTGDLRYSHLFEYNEKGFCSKLIYKYRSDDEGYVTDFSYMYDDKGNYINKHIISEYSKSIEERTIVYY